MKRFKEFLNEGLNESKLNKNQIVEILAKHKLWLEGKTAVKKLIFKVLIFKVLIFKVLILKMLIFKVLILKKQI